MRSFIAMACGLAFLFTALPASAQAPEAAKKPNAQQVMTKDQFVAKLWKEKTITNLLCTKEAVLVKCMTPPAGQKTVTAEECAKGVTADLEKKLKKSTEKSPTEGMLYKKIQLNLAAYHQDFWTKKIAGLFIKAAAAGGYKLKTDDQACLATVVPILKVR